MNLGAASVELHLILNSMLKNLRKEFEMANPSFKEAEISAMMEAVYRERIVIGVYGTGGNFAKHLLYDVLTVTL